MKEYDDTSPEEELPTIKMIWNFVKASEKETDECRDAVNQLAEQIDLLAEQIDQLSYRVTKLEQQKTANENNQDDPEWY